MEHLNLKSSVQKNVEKLQKEVIYQSDSIKQLREEQGNIVELEEGEYHLLEGENKHFYIYVGNGKLNKYSLSA